MAGVGGWAGVWWLVTRISTEKNTQNSFLYTQKRVMDQLTQLFQTARPMRIFVSVADLWVGHKIECY